MPAKKGNKYALGNKGGRPPKYSSDQELKERVNEYWKLCDEKNQLPEKAGLCLHLGISRDTYNAYKQNKEFSDTLKGVELYIESAWVRRLNGQAATGAIFYLKNAFKDEFRDKVETEHSGNLTISEVEINVRR